LKKIQKSICGGKNMDWQSLADRLLGFLPDSSVFWSALGTAFSVLLIQFVVRWVDRKTEQPWRKVENQRKRQQILDRFGQKSRKE